MAVTFQNAANVQPLINGEVVVATITGPFDILDAYVSGGAWPDGTLVFSIYATVGAVRAKVAIGIFAGPTAARITWRDPNGEPIEGSVQAGGTQYDLVVLAQPNQSFQPALPAKINATLAGVDQADVAADANTSGTAVVGATIATAAGYNEFADVSAAMAGLPGAIFQLLASCGAGSVEAVIADAQTGGPDATAVVMKGVALPAATSYRIVAQPAQPGTSFSVTASLSTYFVSGSAGAVPVPVGGDLSGTTAAATVQKINGSTVPAGPLTTGTVLRATGAASLGYGAVDLANAAAVTGVLPLANQAPEPPQALGGDLSGTTAVATVQKLNGSTVPAGPLTTGAVLRVTGAASLAYGPVDLADTDAVTGVLPEANQVDQTMGGDVTGTTAAAVVAKVNGTSITAAPSVGSPLVATSTTAATWVDPNQGSIYQPFSLPLTHKIRWWSGETTTNSGTGQTAGLQYWGWSGLTFNSVSSKPAFATTSKLAGTTRIRFGGTTTSNAGFFEGGYINAGVPQYGAWRGNAAGRGGFLFKCRFAIAQVGVTSVIHMFCGLSENGGIVVAYDWTTDTTLCKLGIGFTATTTAGGALPSANWQAIESAHSAPHLTDLGASFPLTVNDFLEVILYAAPNASTATLIVNNLTTGATTGALTLNSNLPTSTTPLLPIINQGTASIVSGSNFIDVSGMYLELFDG